MEGGWQEQRKGSRGAHARQNSNECTHKNAKKAIKKVDGQGRYTEAK